MKKTYSPKAKDIRERWHVVDATDRVLGRLASEVAQLLRGKHEARFARHMSSGDRVVVVNAEKVRVTGRKAEQKVYYRHTQYPGGLRTTTYRRMMETHPTRIIEHAVKGMLPHNRLGRQLMRNLRVYVGPEHPHQPQVRAAEKKEEEA